MREKIKKWLDDGLTYLSLGIWIGSGVAVGFLAMCAILLRIWQV